MAEFMNDDERLQERAEAVLEARKKAGLENMVGGLEAVIINVEPERHKEAVQEYLDCTGLTFRGAYEDVDYRTCVLKLDGSADFLIRCRKSGENPFRSINDRPKTSHMPNARLETFVYRVNDLEAYAARQKEQGRQFMTEAVVEHEGFSFIQTPPSPFTGNSLGFVQWRDNEGEYITEDSQVLEWTFNKPDKPYLDNIGELDHCATRVKAEERDDAIIEFMEYTNYYFDFAVYVDALNSITNVARLSPDDFAMVFTSGIKPFTTLEESGPTERYIYNYGVRVHHMAFNTVDIDHTFDMLKQDGMDFLVELVGSPEEGLKQTFTQSSPTTFLVNEYIHRYGDFDGFFTKSNVTKLTKATEKQ